jgi:hypothetical protein
MIDVASDLRAEIDSALPRLRALTEAQVTADRGAGKWVKKELLGHLIDSADNNHQRVVRAQASDPLVWPGYDQDEWVAVHAYRSRAWPELIDLWSALNRHVACAIESVPAGRLATRCVIGDNQPATLEWLMRDYVNHLRHHVSQILLVLFSVLLCSSVSFRVFLCFSVA